MNKFNDQLAKQLFNQSVVYSRESTGVEWSKAAENDVDNCKFHAKQFLIALDKLGLEIKTKGFLNE